MRAYTYRPIADRKKLAERILKLSALARQNRAIEETAHCLRFYAGDQLDQASLTHGAGHSGPGWYVHSTEYPDEGAEFLGNDREVVEVAAFIVGMERSGGLICTECDKNPATCIGRYDNMAVAEPGCDECCGHGNEDGHCEPIESPS